MELVMVKNNRNSVSELDGVKLMPGWNKVSKAAWLAARKHPIVKLYIDVGDVEEDASLKVVTEKKVDKQTKVVTEKKVVDLSKVGPAKAIDFVNNLLDLEMLNELALKEKRKTVLAAIKKQVAALEAPPVFRDGGDKKDSDVEVDAE